MFKFTFYVFDRQFNFNIVFNPNKKNVINLLNKFCIKNVKVLFVHKSSVFINYHNIFKLLFIWNISNLVYSNLRQQRTASVSLLRVVARRSCAGHWVPGRPTQQHDALSGAQLFAVAGVACPAGGRWAGWPEYKVALWGYEQVLPNCEVI